MNEQNSQPLKSNIKAHANFFSVFTFAYTIPIVWKGFWENLDRSDLTEPLQEHESSLLGDELSGYWTVEAQKAKEEKRTPSFFNVLNECYGPKFWKYGLLLSLMELGTRFFQPIFLGLYIRYFNAKSSPSSNPDPDSPTYLARVFNYWQQNQTDISEEEAALYAGGICFCTVINVLTYHPIMMGLAHLGMKMRVASCSLIYRKTLRVSLPAISGTGATASVINLISNDVNRFDNAIPLLPYIWIAPLQTLGCLYFMYKDVGIAAVVGFTVVIIFIPLQIYLGRLTIKYRNLTATRTETRVKQMNEILRSIEVIKMYAWEYPFIKKINKQRADEIEILKMTGIIKGTMMSFIMFTARGAVFVTGAVYAMGGYEVTAEKLFFVLAFYQILRQTMTVYFPQGISQLAELIVALRRINIFLINEESNIGSKEILEQKKRKRSIILPHRTISSQIDPDILGANARVKIKHASAYFREGEEVLHDINLKLKPGTLTAIVGQVGSGKSCLANLLLGELKPYKGKVNIQGQMAYASQEPWLFAGTVRSNILFGRTYDAEHYFQVVQVCALLRDFSLLPLGDATIVGDRGVSLSGGQRARINLARAVYKKADIYIFDDPLSAVDPQVANHLFERCIRKFLNQKIVVLITNQLQFLSRVKQIVILIDGRIEIKGDMAKLASNQSDFVRFLTYAARKEEERSDQESRDEDIKLEAFRNIMLAGDMQLGTIDIEKGQQFNTTEEVKIQKHNSFKEYFCAGASGSGLFLLCLLFLGAQGCATAADIFLQVWVHSETQNHYDTVIDNPNFVLYGVFIVSTMFVALTRAFYFFVVCMHASIELHNRMFNRIIQGALEFFKNNSCGVILNRFSKDLGAIDDFLPAALIDSFQIFGNLVGAAVVVGISSWLLLVPTILTTAIFWFMRFMYVPCSMTIKRLEGSTKSPLLAHANATVRGITTIRSNKAEKRLVELMDSFQDVHSSAWFLSLATSRGFCMWVDLICTLYISWITYSFLWFEASPSSVGLVITQCIGLSGFIQWGFKQSAEMESQLTSVERVIQLSKIRQEPPFIESYRPSADWPKTGEVELYDVVMFYNPREPPVLKNLTLSIRDREKVGIVGRTGAGKSSLIATIFRLEQFSGSVIIDGINTKKIGLHDLRNKISIIPQDPVLFQGSLRYNLDPFMQYKDEEVLNALSAVDIKAYATDGPKCLQLAVAEDGTNISLGERQMICLARAILRNNRILVLDEATANIDPQTDAFIQAAIRSKFSHCTVLTIAHRLHTVMDSDRVLVMEAGRAVEFDHPHILLQNPTGYFTRMVEMTGPSMEENLRYIAEINYKNKMRN